MRIYTAILGGFTIHIIAALVLIATAGSIISALTVIDINIVFAGIIGIVVGLINMSLVVGVIAVLFEIRDLLAALNEEVPG